MREHPNLDQLRRQAKELLEAFTAGEHAAVAEVNAHYRDADPANFALHDAQLVLARSYGFDSWPKLKAYADGVTVKRLADAVRAGDLAQVRAMVTARPELVNMDMAENDEHRAVHYAVLERAPEMVRVLMEHGADARKGIYPHREATGALTLARERGYDEIAAIIEDEEQRRRAAISGPNTAGAAAIDELIEAMRDEDNERAVVMMESGPALIGARNRGGWTPLHMAAAMRNDRLVGWLLDHGADVNQLGPRERTPLDVASRTRWWKPGRPKGFTAVAAMLRQKGAELTPASAVALGEADWLRARYAESALANPAHANIFDSPPGLLTIAVQHDRPEILEMLLDLGFDPDERMRLDGLEETVYSWGSPLWHCARAGKRAMAEMLLKRGADPNGQVYASGSVMYSAHFVHDGEMVKLLESYGGLVDAATAGHLRLTEQASQMLADEDAGRLRDGTFMGESLVEELLWGGLRGGDPEIVRMTLERVDWPRDDPRWHGKLWSPLPGHEMRSEADRRLYLECFRLVLERCDPNIRHPRVGRTILHDVAGLDDEVPAEEALAYATMLLDAGARWDVRDDLLKSTPLGWACRWGRVELVKLLLERGADALEADAEPWATPRAWAEKMGHAEVLVVLREHGQRGAKM
jgi:ankyrin repeat protein